MNDSRKDDRLLVVLTTRYREPTMLEPREGECRDLSPSGMFIGTARPSPRGALIRFECISDKPEDGFRGTGRVVWQRTKADDRGHAGMGVRFVRLEAGGREALERTLARLGKRRPISRTPRVVPAAAPSGRPQEGDAQSAPIFAAGANANAAAKTSNAPAGKANSAKPATASNAPGGTNSAAPAKDAASNPPASDGKAGTAAPAAQAASTPAEAATAGAAAGAAATSAAPAAAAATPTGAAAPSASAPPSEAPAGDDSQFGQQRSATLRGIPKQDGVLFESEAPAAGASNAPGKQEAPARGGSHAATRPGLSPLPPAPAKNTGPNELRDRLGRTRRGVGPWGARGDETPTATHSRPQDAGAEPTPSAGDSNRTFASTLRGAPGSDRPAKEAAQQVAAEANAESREQHHSDRPPQPGGVDDLRARAPAGQNGSHRPAGHPFAKTTLSEVVARGDEWPPYNRPRALPSGAPRAEHDPTEKRIPIPDEAERERYSQPDVGQRRRENRAFFWIIAGSGIVMSLVVIRLFGGVLPGIPGGEKAETPPDEKAATSATTTSTGTDAVSAPYNLAVVSQPAGARVTVAGQTVVTPGSVRIDHLDQPLQVTGELQGYTKVTSTVWQSQFERKGDAYEGRVELVLQPVVKTAARTVPPNAATAAATPVSTQAQAAKPREHERASSPPRRPSTSPRTPHRTPRDLPSPEPTEPTPSLETSPVVTVSERPGGEEPPLPDDGSESQQTPLAQALDCLARGDNRCVIRALEDKATSARELELLIETYRAVGSTPRAERQMQRYLERYPEAQHAAEYRRLLERRSPGSTAPAPAPETPQ